MNNGQREEREKTKTVHCLQRDLLIPTLSSFTLQQSFNSSKQIYSRGCRIFTWFTVSEAYINSIKTVIIGLLTSEYIQVMGVGFSTVKSFCLIHKILFLLTKLISRCFSTFSNIIAVVGIRSII